MSNSPHLRVEQAGPQTLLQDGGRFGVRHLGITQGGPMDWHAAGWANVLLGNAYAAPVLEITIGGLTLAAGASTPLALAGADLGAARNGQALAPWQRFQLSAGDRLTFGLPRTGLRAYLAVPGGWLGDVSLGSVACVPREGLGGHKGGGWPVAAGDQLAFQPQPSTNLPAADTVPQPHRIDYAQPARLGLIPGGQAALFDGFSLYQAFNREWTVATRADRMGIRLNGPELTCHHNPMVSEGIPTGAVQVPTDGQPFCLMNDRQTIGGYPRLGTLTPLARARLAQCPPGHPVHLHACGTGTARRAWRAALDAMTGCPPPA
ncbi:biotin-dependent carboxyltransferase family protein [Halomonadaceae bacterium KBTZ08]